MNKKIFFAFLAIFALSLMSTNVYAGCGCNKNKSAAVTSKNEALKQVNKSGQRYLK